jgi:hypothetical protein
MDGNWSMMARAPRSRSEALLFLVLGHAVRAPFGLGLACVAAGGLIFLAGGRSVGSLAVILGLGVTLGGSLTWIALRETVSRPLARITKATEVLSVQDTAALSDMLAAIAQGDLSNRLEPRGRPVSLAATSSVQVRQLGEAINAITARLAEGAVQLNTVTDEPNRRLFYVGPDDYSQGKTCGDLMGRTIGGKGQIAVITRDLKGVSLDLRRKGLAWSMPGWPVAWQSSATTSTTRPCLSWSRVSSLPPLARIPTRRDTTRPSTSSTTWSRAGSRPSRA